MKMIKTLVAATAALSACAASAQVTGGLGSLGPSFLTLSGANVTGGALYNATQTFSYAARPTNTSPAISTVGNWLAVGGASNANNGGGATGTLKLGTGTTGVSFLWGSVDTYNSVQINTTAGSKTFTHSMLGLTANQDWYKASYVNFAVTNPGATITSIDFLSSGTAFEVANITAVPEPGTYAMLLSGLAAVGFVSRRRRAGAGEQPLRPAA
ncbi:MAG: PEP-CTERM sorting domain-containing protein [Rubrivivax sp.]